LTYITFAFLAFTVIGLFIRTAVAFVIIIVLIVFIVYIKSFKRLLRLISVT
jgi:hypothetical protein